jgi:hypothetical protein
MSKIALVSPAGGTATFSITTPSGTSTDRTLTLPDAAGTIQVSGNPISGTTGTFTGLVNISAAGAGQIQFPATQNASANANTLDDYEEGTWTPGIAFGGNAVGVTYTSNRYGRYTKIGERVIATCYFALSSKGSSTGGVSFTGLPFTTNSNANGGFVSAALWMSGISVTNGIVTSYTNANATTLDVNFTATNGDASGANALTDGYVSGTASVMISVSYLTS